VNVNIGAVMKRILPLAFVLFLGGGVAQTALAQVPEPLNLVKRAVDAMDGGSVLLLAVRPGRDRSASESTATKNGWISNSGG
jgi:hypothetical protein